MKNYNPVSDKENPNESTSPVIVQHEETIEKEDCCGTIHPQKSPETRETNKWQPYIPTGLSLLLLLTGITLDFISPDWFDSYVRFVWYGIAYFLVGREVLWNAVTNIRRGEVFNEFFLMGVATLGAFYLGEYAEGVAVMLFYVVGEHFQEMAVKRSRRSIKALIDNRPETVNAKRNGRFVRINPALVDVGETIQIKAGEKVALDGEMLSLSASFNTSALTGEAKPRTLRKGERILAGMVNLDKVVELKVTAAYEDSTLSKILALVEEAGGRKAKTQRFITRFAKIYTPIVVFLALALVLLPYFLVEQYVFNDWLYRSLVFLVISCPCALVISIPLGYFGGIGAASKNGILFKGSNFLDLITKVDALVMDKTGTITKGIFKVQKVEVSQQSGITKEKFLALTAALESHSNHPVARALVAYAGLEGKHLKVNGVEELSGLGLKGTVEGMDVLAGNTALLEKYGITYDKELDKLVETVIAVAINGRYSGHITISDEVKEDAERAIQTLRNYGIKEIILLSGDKSPVVNAIARQLGIDKAFGNLLPQDKVSHVEALKRQGKTVAFVGDGINDAPVIALADIGIAMGGLGSDAAIESADVVIQNDQPSNVATAIQIGKKTKQVVWQNIGLAFGVKAIVLTFGAFGIASLWEAVFADVGVALLAILNAVRIQRFF